MCFSPFYLLSLLKPRLSLFGLVGATSGSFQELLVILLSFSFLGVGYYKVFQAYLVHFLPIHFAKETLGVKNKDSDILVPPQTSLIRNFGGGQIWCFLKVLPVQMENGLG